ncbi:MAG: dihydroneopterin aldolase [Magnetococcales bacterium]|nr:dihydroneopterin aldolase [Magnetococcales bacterium]
MSDIDRIFIKDLRLRCIIGIREWERKTLQNVVINLTLSVDLAKAGQSDDIDDTVNYKTLCKRIISMTEASHFFLVEALAEKIAQIALEDERIHAVEVQVEKPGALRFADSVGVIIERKRAE